MKVTTRLRSQQYQNWMRRGPERTEESLRLFKERGPPIIIGEMRNQESIDSRETPYGFTVLPRASYAGFVDQGTKPHIIEPKTAKVLRWFGPWGNPIFARRVKHPGTTGIFFVRKTVDAVKDRIKDLLDSIWREVHGFR